MIVVVIVLLDSRVREDFLGRFEPLLVKVEPALLADVSSVMLLVSVALINLNTGLHFGAAEHAADNK
jgi:hypothetical protein